MIAHNVAQLHLESSANESVTVTLGKNMQVPVMREEGCYGHQQAEWQMSDGCGSDWATIHCGQQVALISWSSGRILQRSGSLEVTFRKIPMEYRSIHTHPAKPDMAWLF